MEIFFDPINLLLLVAAVTILIWLKSVLGQRTGFERTDKNIEILPPKPKLEIVQNPIPKSDKIDLKTYILPSALASLEALNKIQPDFDVQHFMNGAKSAYETILDSFAKGDKQTLKPLLSKSVYDSFESAIDDAKQNRRNNALKFVGIKEAKINTIEIENKAVSIGVNFESEVISDEDQTVIQQQEFWTFERDLNSKDPNWKLVATHEPLQSTGGG